MSDVLKCPRNALSLCVLLIYNKWVLLLSFAALRSNNSKKRWRYKYLQRSLMFNSDRCFFVFYDMKQWNSFIFDSLPCLVPCDNIDGCGIAETISKMNLNCEQKVKGKAHFEHYSWYFFTKTKYNRKKPNWLLSSSTFYTTYIKWRAIKFNLFLLHVFFELLLYVVLRLQPDTK